MLISSIATLILMYIADKFLDYIASQSTGITGSAPSTGILMYLCTYASPIIGLSLSGLNAILFRNVIFKLISLFCALIFITLAALIFYVDFLV